jgi:hypothetical protein
MAPPGYPEAQKYVAPYRQRAVNPGVPHYAEEYPADAYPATAYSAQFVAPYATPYAYYAPPSWKRSWGTTMGRWGIGVAVAFVTSTLLGTVAGMGEATAEGRGEVAGMLAVGTWMYVLIIPWWLDHIVAGWGKAGTWAIHGRVSLLLALVNFAYLSIVASAFDLGIYVGAAPWWVLVMWAVAWGLGMLLADLRPKSYPPKAYPPKSYPPKAS